MKIQRAVCTAWMTTCLGLSALVTGCDDPRKQRCEQARHESATAWQAYETVAREQVNHLDDDAAQAARSASEAATNADRTAATSIPLLSLLDVMPESTGPEAGIVLHFTPATGSDLSSRRNELEAARRAALGIAQTVRDTAVATRETATAITARDSDDAHAAADRARDASARVTSSAAQITAAAALRPDAGAGDAISNGMTRLSEAVGPLVQSAHDAAQSAQRAADTLDTALEGLERANAALTASGAAYRNAVQARNAAQAVPDDREHVQRARATTASEAAWQSCNGN